VSRRTEKTSPPRLRRPNQHKKQKTNPQKHSHHHPNLAGLVDAIFDLSAQWCAKHGDADFDALQNYLTTCLVSLSFLFFPLGGGERQESVFFRLFFFLRGTGRFERRPLFLVACFEGGEGAAAPSRPIPLG